MNEETGLEAFQQMQAEFEKVAETMWRNEIANTVLELLERDGNVTKASLSNEVINRIADENRSRLERATYQGALKALNGNPPT